MNLSIRQTRFAGGTIEPRSLGAASEGGETKVTDQNVLNPTQESATDRSPEPLRTHTILLGLVARPQSMSPKFAAIHIPDVIWLTPSQYLPSFQIRRIESPV